MTPKVFISYSWDNEAHKAWVKELATRLRADGADVTLDRWATAPGDGLPQFMETAIRENDFVVIVLTPNYKRKSDNREGGVGYEGDIMTGEVFTGQSKRKFIPALREGSWTSAAPSWLNGKYGINLSGNPYSEDQYRDLLFTLHGAREQPPPIGSPPVLNKQAAQPVAAGEPMPFPGFDPIRILGIAVNEVGEPRNDGTRGSALYEVPFKLSRRPPDGWAELFIPTWDHPPRWTTSHRPGTARVIGDRIVLTRTTIEEVQQTHRETLKLVVDTVNEEYERLARKHHAIEAAKTQERQDHRAKVQRIAGDLEGSW
jgi:hypothetical protein